MKKILVYCVMVSFLGGVAHGTPSVENDCLLRPPTLQRVRNAETTESVVSSSSKSGGRGALRLGSKGLRRVALIASIPLVLSSSFLLAQQRVIRNSEIARYRQQYMTEGINSARASYLASSQQALIRGYIEAGLDSEDAEIIAHITARHRLTPQRIPAAYSALTTMAPRKASLLVRTVAERYPERLKSMLAAIPFVVAAGNTRPEQILGVLNEIDSSVRDLRAFPDDNTTADRLIALGLPVIFPLVDDFSGTDFAFRSQAVRIISSIGDEAMDVLIKTVVDGDQEFSSIALRILGLAKEESAVEPCITIIENFRGNEITVFISAITALGRIGDARAVTPLLRIASGRRFPASARVMAAEALGKIKDTTAVAPLLDIVQTEILLIGHTSESAPAKDDTRDIVTAAILALGDLGDLQALKTLASIATSHEGVVRSAAFDAICRIAGVEGHTYVEEYIKRSPQLRAELTALLARCHAAGIDFPLRFERKILEALVANLEQSRPDERPLAVVVYPKTDWNGAFYESPVAKELVSHGYRVMYYEASSDEETVQCLRRATAAQQAAVIVLGGHGTKTSLTLSDASGEAAEIDISDEVQLRRASGALEDGGQIILESCSTGAEKEYGNNLANLLRRVFPQALEQGIWSATEITSIVGLEFDEHNVLVRVFYGKGSGVYRAEVPLEDQNQMYALLRHAETLEYFADLHAHGIYGPEEPTDPRELRREARDARLAAEGLLSFPSPSVNSLDSQLTFMIASSS
jgi:HEAT repeat protein